MILPKPSPQYSAENEAQTRASLIAEDARNVKNSDYATTAKRGVVRVDGTTITAAEDGTISALIPPAAPTGTFLVSGGQVVWISGYTFAVSAAVYFINGTEYSSAQQNITLATADAANDRIDTIAVDNTGAVIAVEGTAQPDPSAPDLNPATQLGLSLVLVEANSTEPAGVSNVLVYDENSGGPGEWNWSISGSGWTLNASADPYSGARYIDGTNVSSGSYGQGQIASGSLDPSVYQLVAFYLKSKSAWNRNRGLQISLRSSGVLVGAPAAINASGSFGFSSSITDAYQLVAIPLSQFAVPAGKVINQIRFSDFGGAINFELDRIFFQAGVQTTGENFAPLNAAFVTIGNDPALTGERALTAGTGIAISDGGANGVVTLSAAPAIAAAEAYADAGDAATLAAAEAYADAHAPVGANPSATAGDVAVNGSAATFMRSDAAPAVQKASSSAFGIVRVDGSTITASGGVISSTGGATGADPTATAKDTAINGAAATFMRSDAAPAVQKASSSQYGIVKPDGTTITDNGSGVLSAVSGGISAGSAFSPTMQRESYIVALPGGTLSSFGDAVSAFGATGGNSGSVNSGIILSTTTSSGYDGNAIYLINKHLNATLVAGLTAKTNVRAWIGLASNAPMSDSDTPANSYIGFRYSTSAGDLNWQCMSSDGTTVNVVDSGVAPVGTGSNNDQQFAIVTGAGTSADFYINGSKVATINSHLPSSATGLRYMFSARAITATGTDLFVGWARIFMDATPS